MSETVLHELTAAPSRPGERLDKVLAAALPELSRSRIAALCAAGAATIDGQVARAADKVRAGQHLTLNVPPPEPATPQPEQIELSILFEDDQLLILNKPPGLVVHPAPGNASGTLVNALLNHCSRLSGIGGVARPGIVHRLDKETSGCIAVAKTDLAHQSLSRQFAGREVGKVYLALAARRATFDKTEVMVRIGRHPVHRKRMAVVDAPKGREARTLVERLRSGDGWTLFRCDLLTGRTHQIRVHLKHLGHPLLGDPIYGGPPPGKDPFGDVGRVMLHSWQLALRHPASGEPLRCEAPVPQDFQAFLESR